MRQAQAMLSALGNPTVSKQQLLANNFGHEDCFFGTQLFVRAAVKLLRPRVASESYLENMGENAKKTWDWHNTVVGVGYQAKGVVRQRVSEDVAPKVVDMRSSAIVPASQRKSSSPPSKVKKEKRKKEKKSKSSKRKSESESDASDSDVPDSKRSKFNPLLQALSMRLRDNIINHR